MIFISYSVEDYDEYVADFRKSLEDFVEGEYDVWTDRSHLEAGAGWEENLDEVVRRAKVAVPLVSSNYLGSDFIVKRELPRLLKAHFDGRLRVAPLYLTACNAEAVPCEVEGRKESISITALQGLNDPGRPISHFEGAARARAYAEAALKIRDLAKAPIEHPSPPPTSEPEEADLIRNVQQALRDRGHRPGAIDGRMGPRTQQALSAFRKEQGLPSSGQVDEPTRKALFETSAAAVESETQPTGEAAGQRPEEQVRAKREAVQKLVWLLFRMMRRMEGETARNERPLEAVGEPAPTEGMEQVTVGDIASEFGVKNSKVISALKEMGVQAAPSGSTLDEHIARRVRQRLQDEREASAKRERETKGEQETVEATDRQAEATPPAVSPTPAVLGRPLSSEAPAIPGDTEAPAPPPRAQFVLLDRYQPPDNRLLVRINSKTVTLEYDRRPYTGPNLLQASVALPNVLEYPLEYGEQLFQTIVHNQQSGAGRRARTTEKGFYHAVEESDGKLRLELRLDANELDLHQHRWEYLKPRDAPPLAVVERAPFYRRVEGPRDQLLVESNRLKILVAICNPRTLKDGGVLGLKELQSEQELEIADTALKPLKDSGLADYEILHSLGDAPAVTLDLLREKLQEGVHVLHLLAHGFFDPKKGNQYFLLMESKDKGHEFVPAVPPSDGPVLRPGRDFRLLTQAGDLRLVILAACQSATTKSFALRGLGPRLALAGVPAVIAMQDDLPMVTAQRFVQRFYDDLGRSGRVDMAMAATRQALYMEEDARLGNWGIPVLLMSSDDGQLFYPASRQVSQLPELEPVIKRYPGLEHARLASLMEQQAQRLTVSPLHISLPPPSLLPGAGPSEVEETVPVQQRDRLGVELSVGGRIDPSQLSRFITQTTPLVLPASVHRQVAAALNIGNHIMLVGPPGTGKTSLAHAICAYAESQKLAAGKTVTTATADWTTFDTIGGYIPTARQTLRFRPGIFLRAILNGEWLVIDEFNRSEIDKAFGEVFTVLSGQRVDLPYLVAGHPVRLFPPHSSAATAEGRRENRWIPVEATEPYDYVIHPNWRILATMNVYDKSSLFNISLALMRRFAFIDVDLPEPRRYRNLRMSWIREAGFRGNQITVVGNKLNEIFDDQSTLMQRRALGPAIARQMIFFAGNCLPTKPDETLADLVAEAFLLYAAPQLDGLDHDAICTIYTELSKIFGEAAHKKGILQRIEGLYPYIPRTDWKRK